MPLVFDDEVAAAPAGTLVFDDETPSAGTLVFDEEPADIKTPPQSPIETGIRAMAQAPGQTAMSAYSGLGRAASTAADTLKEKLPAPLGTVAGGLLDAYTYIPRNLAPLAKDIANESERVYAPDRQRNPKAATFGSGFGQALPMSAAALALGPAAAIAIGAAQGMDQGLDQAEEMGITSPASRLALGATYAGIEATIERMGGIGSKAFTTPAKRTIAEMLKAGGKTIGAEGLEEPITGTLQDAAAVAFAPNTYDPSALLPVDVAADGYYRLNQDYINRRGYETLGGLAGGLAGAGFQTLANRTTPPTEAPTPSTVEADPLAAYAATMPAMATADARSVESGLFDAPAIEGDLLRDFAIPPRTSPLPPPIENWPPAFSGPAAEDFSNASVTPSPATGVTIPPAETRQEAPVTIETDAGSTPATGGTVSDGVMEQGSDGTPLVQPSTYSGPAFGSSGGPSVRSTPVIPDAPYGGRDVLDFVNDNTIAVPRDVLDYIEGKRGSRLNKEGRGGDYDFLEKYDIPKSFRKYLFREGDTGNINEVAQRAHEEGFIDEPTPDALMGKILETINARESYTNQVNAREQQLAEEEAALLERENEQRLNAQAGQNETPSPEDSGTDWSIEEEISWADRVIADSQTTPFIGFDPRLATAYAIKGAQLIRGGFTTLSQWTAEMLRRFGTSVRDYLKGAWEGAQKTSQQGFIGGDPVRLTHAAERARMDAEGKQPLPTEGQGTVDEWKAEAAARVQQPGAATALVKDIIEKQRTHTPVEYYMLMNYAGALDQQIEQLSRTLANPQTSAEERQAAASTLGGINEERDNIAIAAQIAGSKAGATLGVRSRGMERDAIPSLSKMVADLTLIEDPTGRTPLAPEERARIEKIHANLTEKAAAVEKQEANASTDALHAELKKLLEEARAEISAQKERLEAQEHALNVQPTKLNIYTKSRDKLKDWSQDGKAAREELLKMIGVRTNISFGIEMMPQVARIVRGFMADGFLTADAVAKKLVKAVPPDFYNSLRKFLPQIMDAAQKLARDDSKIKTPGDVRAKALKSVQQGNADIAAIARQLALAHITEHIANNDRTLSAEKIAALVRKDLEEFKTGITLREARDMISGYGKTLTPSKDIARKTLRDYKAQMQKLTQIEALMNQEPLLRSGLQRDEPSARLRELQKQVEDLKREVGYQPRSREEELKSIRDRIKKSLENQIEELQRVLAGKARPSAGKQRVVYDQELQNLQTLRNHLRDLVAEMPDHKRASEERRNKTAIKAALAVEAEYKRRIASKEWFRLHNRPTPSADLTAARAQAAAARAEFNALKKAANPAHYEAESLRTVKKRLQQQINDVQTRIAKSDFEPRKRTVREIKHDQESTRLKHELQKARRQWEEMKLKHKLDHLSMTRKAWWRVRKTYHLSRSILTGGEFSGLLRQGLLKTISHPMRVFANDVPAMIKAFRSAQGEFEVMNEIASRPNALNGRYKLAKLAIHDPADFSAQIAEGNARSAWMERLAKWEDGTAGRVFHSTLGLAPRFINGTSRAYTALLNHMRADLFDMMVEKLDDRKSRQGQAMTEDEFKAVADFVNDTTGAGKMGILDNRPGSKDLLGMFMFSPSFVSSRIRTLLGASMIGGSMATRQAIAGEYLRIAAGMAAMYAVAAALQASGDDEPEEDPRSSNFGKVRYGKTALDLTAGLGNTAVLIARTWMGEIKKASGQTVPIRGADIPYGGQTYGDVAGKWVRSKLSPGAGFAWNRLSGTDFTGAPADIKKDAMNMLMPITYGDIADIWKTQPASKAVPLTAAAMLGLSTQTYDQPPRR